MAEKDFNFRFLTKRSLWRVRISGLRFSIGPAVAVHASARMIALDINVESCILMEYSKAQNGDLREWERLSFVVICKYREVKL